MLNFSLDDKINCLKVCSGIVHLGEMKFKQRPREEQAEPDGDEGYQPALTSFSITRNLCRGEALSEHVRRRC